MAQFDAYQSLQTLLLSVPDPRRARGLRHPVADVLFMALVAVISGAEDAEAIEDFANENEAWFAQRCATLRRLIAGFFQDAHREGRPKDQPAPAIADITVTDAGHGRVEVRQCELSTDLSWVDDRASWCDLGCIIKVSRQRETKASDKNTHEHGFFISSDASLTPRRAEKLARNHWHIENGLHWVLDVAFDEDGLCIRTKHAAEYLAIIRRAALNLLKTAPSPKKTKAAVTWPGAVASA